MREIRPSGLTRGTKDDPWSLLYRSGLAVPPLPFCRCRFAVYAHRDGSTCGRVTLARALTGGHHPELGCTALVDILLEKRHPLVERLPDRAYRLLHVGASTEPSHSFLARSRAEDSAMRWNAWTDGSDADPTRTSPLRSNRISRWSPTASWRVGCAPRTRTSRRSARSGTRRPLANASATRNPATRSSRSRRMSATASG